jgi:hypothetical protein
MLVPPRLRPHHASFPVPRGLHRARRAGAPRVRGRGAVDHAAAAVVESDRRTGRSGATGRHAFRRGGAARHHPHPAVCRGAGPGAEPCAHLRELRRAAYRCDAWRTACHGRAGRRAAGRRVRAAGADPAHVRRREGVARGRARRSAGGGARAHRCRGAGAVRRRASARRAGVGHARRHDGVAHDRAGRLEARRVPDRARARDRARHRPRRRGTTSQGCGADGGGSRTGQGSAQAGARAVRRGERCPGQLLDRRPI